MEEPVAAWKLWAAAGVSIVVALTLGTLAWWGLECFR